MTKTKQMLVMMFIAAIAAVVLAVPGLSQAQPALETGLGGPQAAPYGSIPGRLADGGMVYLPLLFSNFSYGWMEIMTEDFEGDFPGEWIVREFPDEPDVEYLWGKRDCRVYEGSYSGWGVGGGADGSALGCGSNYPDQAASWMIYGPFSLVGMTAADLSFAYWVNSENEYYSDFFYGGASKDGSKFYGQDFYGSSGSWQTYVLDLTGVYDIGDLTGEEEVWVAFLFQSNGSTNMQDGAFVDDIILRKCASGCGAVSEHAFGSGQSGSKQVFTSE